MAQGDRRVTQRILPRDATAVAADAAHALGANPQYLVGRCADRQPWAGELRRRQGRAQQRNQGAVAGGRVKGRHGERDCARDYCLADGGCGVRCGADSAVGAGQTGREAGGGCGAGGVSGE